MIWADSKVKKLGWVDIAFVKMSVLFFALMIVKFWPEILSLSWGWYAGAFVVLAIRPLTKVFA